MKRYLTAALPVITRIGNNAKLYFFTLKRHLIIYIRLLDRQQSRRFQFAIAMVVILFLILQISLFIICNTGTKSSNNKVKSVQNEFGERVEILDRNGIILAKDIISYDFYFRPAQVLNVENEITKIGQIIPKVRKKLDKILQKSIEKRNDPKAIILIQSGISDEDRRNLLKGGVVGMEMQEKKSRYYMHDNLFSHILGGVSDDGNGLAGIEKSISEGKIPYENAVELSVDVKIQQILHDTLEVKMKESSAKAAFGVVADVKTGEIIAAVSLPDYNPNDKSTMQNFDSMFNRFSLGVYEFGSIFKIINTTLALTSGLSLNKIYDVSRDLEIDGRVIGEIKRSRNTMTLEEVLLYSSNVGSVKVLLDSGIDKQRDFFHKLGFNQKVGIEIPERGGFLIPGQKDWRGVRAATMSYGHGIAITQLHLLRALSSIMNDGRFTDLTLLKHNGTLEDRGQVTSPEISKKMLDVIRNIVQIGAARSAKSRFYDIGGKSGTAIKTTDKGQYSKGKNLVSFFAAFPMNDPKYAMILSVDEPRWSENARLAVTGGGVLGGVTRDMIHAIGFFSNIPTMTKAQNEAIKIQNLMREVN